LKDAGVTDINLGAPPDLSPADALKRVIEAKDALKAALG
jgi:hypothetical protein